MKRWFLEILKEAVPTGWGLLGVGYPVGGARKNDVSVCWALKRGMRSYCA